MHKKQMQLIYKIISKLHWLEAVELGHFRGSLDDIRDGFIHFSALEQLKETAQKYFKEQEDLYVFAVDGERLKKGLEWEVSRSEALFPHFYGILDLDLVHFIKPLPLDDNGQHVFPDLI